MATPETPKKAGKPVTGAKFKNLLFQKVAIFVDAENIEMSSLKHHEGRTDYKKILESVGDREIIRVLYYKPAYKEISPDFEAFWGSLGGEIRRPTKNADTFLVIDAVTMAEKIDVAIILGGDKDFLPLMWYLRSRGCRVEIWSWPETTSPEMKEAADLYVPLTEEFVLDMPKRAAQQAQQQQQQQQQSEAPVKNGGGGGGGRDSGASRSGGEPREAGGRNSGGGGRGSGGRGGSGGGSGGAGRSGGGSREGGGGN
jgi:uncharacterized LabA/DUF88 family protein